KVIAPDTVENGLAVKNLTRMTYKQMKEVIFSGRQLDELSPASDLAGGCIHCQIAKRQGLPCLTTALSRLCAVLAPQNCFDTFNQLIKVERFGYIIVVACL